MENFCGVISNILFGGLLLGEFCIILWYVGEMFIVVCLIISRWVVKLGDL